MMKKIGLLLAFAMTSVFAAPTSYAAPYSDYPYLYEDFEEKAENAVNWSNAEYKASNDGYANSAGSLEVKLSGDGQMISVPVNLTPGETYNISCYIKPHDDIKANYINFIFWFKQKMEDGTEGKSEGFSTARINGVSFKSGEWTKVTTSYTFSGQANINGKMEDVVGSGRVSIRFGGGTLSEINGKSEFSYNIDDFCIEPIFEESKVKEPFEEINIISNGDFSSELGGEWISNNAEVEITEDIPKIDDCTFSNSLHVTQTARAGRIYQDISVKSNTKYKLSFWAKGADAGKAIPAFEWDEGEEKQYEYLNDSDLPFEEDWKHYELLYTTSTDISENVRFYIYTKKLQKTDFYLADIKLLEWPFDTTEAEQPGEITTPEIREISADGYLIKDNSISINAEYLGLNAQSGLVQLFKQADDGGWASIKTAEFNGENFMYTFKASDIGHNIKVRIVPMDIDGNVGGYREKNLGKVLDTFEVQSKFTSGLSDDNVSANTVITNWSGNDKDVVCMLLLYDENNACIASGYKNIYTSFGEENILDVAVQNPGNCKSAKLFIWEGESDVNTTMIPVVRCISLTE